MSLELSADGRDTTGQLAGFYLEMAKGNTEAHAFMCAWHVYVHEVDDIIDNKITDPEKLIALLVHAAVLYSLPFYRQHAPRLLQTIKTVSGIYADSVAWEQGGQELWKRQAADTLRHAGIEMVLAVSEICGGYEWSRRFSRALRAMCWTDHHDKYGEPK